MILVIVTFIVFTELVICFTIRIHTTFNMILVMNFIICTECALPLNIFQHRYDLLLWWEEHSLSADPINRMRSQDSPYRQDVECPHWCPSVRDFWLRVVRTAPNHYLVAYIHARPYLDKTIYLWRSGAKLDEWRGGRRRLRSLKPSFVVIIFSIK